MTLAINFLGAAGTVTGSKYLIEHDGRGLLVDCGLLLSFTWLLLRKWASLPIDPRSVACVVAASDALRFRLQERFGWNCMVREEGQKVKLS